ncbi:MAG: hypothetical protein ABIZ81_04530, partial [Opitutaceae bacterium]
MNTPSNPSARVRRALFRAPLAHVLWSFGLLSAAAQSVPPSATQTAASIPVPTTAEVSSGDTTTKNAAVVLSPFEVNDARDNGFAAASAVAGGRLAIDLKDTPASYSVLNREFLDALQITALEQAADWAPNTTRVPDNGHENSFGGAVLVAIRGVAGFFAQRDFFPMEFNFDSYNLDR